MYFSCQISTVMIIFENFGSLLPARSVAVKFFSWPEKMNFGIIISNAKILRQKLWKHRKIL